MAGMLASSQEPPFGSATGVVPGGRGFPTLEAYRAIKLFVFDVDGVLTDGRIVIDNHGNETKFFHVRDGSGISMLNWGGFITAILSGRDSPLVQFRARELKIPPERVKQGAKVKLPVFHALLNECGVTPAQTAYFGDDVIDCPVLELAGIACCPGDAHAEAREVSHCAATERGGHGAVRQLIEHLLKARQDGSWERARGRYLGQA
jgi:3-deoxy-D-manno-octulosonate 8-phosphate phosphatase (KDO 8-P phosphatase)